VFLVWRGLCRGQPRFELLGMPLLAFVIGAALSMAMLVPPWPE
jgi:hypothetical protein